MLLVAPNFISWGAPNVKLPILSWTTRSVKIAWGVSFRVLSVFTVHRTDAVVTGCTEQHHWAPFPFRSHFFFILLNSLQGVSLWFFLLLFQSTLSPGLLCIYLLKQQQVCLFHLACILTECSKIILLSHVLFQPFPLGLLSEMSSDLNDFNTFNYWSMPQPASCRWELTHLLINCYCISILLLLTFVSKTTAEALLTVAQPACHVAWSHFAFSLLIKCRLSLGGNSLLPEGLEHQLCHLIF